MCTVLYQRIRSQVAVLWSGAVSWALGHVGYVRASTPKKEREKEWKKEREAGGSPEKCREPLTSDYCCMYWVIGPLMLD